MTQGISRLAAVGLVALATPILAHHAVQSEKVGEQYTFVGYQARDGSKLAFLESLTGPDGKTVKIWFGDPNAN